MSVITIHRQPFTSPEASILIPKLDQELSDLYPDWSDLPHPGTNVGLLADEEPPKLNPTPDGSANTSILHDAEPKVKAGSHINANDTQHDSDGIIFFVAYLGSSSTSPSVKERDPIGCIGLKIEKYYPHHHPPSSYQKHIQPQIQADIARESHVRTAQLKRLYVEKACRSGKFDPSIASRLLLHAEGFARDIGIKRIVVETGIRQVGALRLYERSGYVYIPNFGDYASASVDVGGVSVCFEKML